MVSPEFKERFIVLDKTLTDQEGFRTYKPHEVKIRSYFRIKGNRNPKNNGIVYLIETNDGRKGTLVYTYDIFQDGKVFNFIQELVDIQMGRKNGTQVIESRVTNSQFYQ